MLHVEGLVAGYGAVVALHGLHLHIDAGETVAIVGPNDAGKITLLRTISVLMKTAGGTIPLRRPLDQRAASNS
jgi:branched-chain amino acid transport system ATP-binding protein